MLKDLSAQILKDSNMAVKAGHSANIEPAAGGRTPDESGGDYE
jgi:hypothetical protein